MAFMTVHLTTVAGFDLIGAGRVLAAYQLAGAVSRPIWGWVADRFLTPNRTLALQGFIMAGAALAAGQFGPHWPVLLVIAVATVAGCLGRRLHRHRLRAIRRGWAGRGAPRRPASAPR